MTSREQSTVMVVHEMGISLFEREPAFRDPILLTVKQVLPNLLLIHTW